MTCILVTGSEGAIGDFVVRELYKQLNNPKIIRISREEKPSTDERSIYYWGDLTDADFLQSIFSENTISTVIACAATWNGLNQDPVILDNNLCLTQSLLCALDDSVHKLIFISSSAVYTAPFYSDGTSISGDTGSTYGNSKLMSEKMIKQAAEQNGFSYTFYRPFHVVSPLESFEPGRSHVFTNFYHKMILINEDIDVNSLPHTTGIGFMWVEDLVNIIVSNLQNKAFNNQTLNVGTTQEQSIKELAIEIVHQANGRGLIATNGNYDAPPPLPPQADGRFDKLHRLYPSFESTNFRDCVSKFIEFRYLKGE